MSETITFTLRGPINDGKQIVIERDLLPDRVGDWDDSGMGVHWYKIELDENGEPTGFAYYDKSQWIIEHKALRATPPRHHNPDSE